MDQLELPGMPARVVDEEVLRITIAARGAHYPVVVTTSYRSFDPAGELLRNDVNVFGHGPFDTWGDIVERASALLRLNPLPAAPGSQLQYPPR